MSKVFFSLRRTECSAGYTECCEVSVLGGFQNLTGQEPQAIWTGFRVHPPSEQEVRLETSRVVCVMLDSTFERNRDTQRL